MSNTQYAVCHLQRGSGNDSGMSCHIESRCRQDTSKQGTGQIPQRGILPHRGDTAPH